VRVAAGTAVPQGTKPTVAIKGYAGDVLIGGVSIETWVPTKVDLFGPRLTPIRPERWMSYPYAIANGSMCKTRTILTSGLVRSIIREWNESSESGESIRRIRGSCEIAWHGHLARDSLRYLVGDCTFFTGKMPVPRLKTPFRNSLNSQDVRTILDRQRR
jgi:hypothetical protein